jgi:hypothetical protein
MLTTYPVGLCIGELEECAAFELSAALLRQHTDTVNGALMVRSRALCETTLTAAAEVQPDVRLGDCERHIPWRMVRVSDRNEQERKQRQKRQYPINQSINRPQHTNEDDVALLLRCSLFGALLRLAFSCFLDSAVGTRCCRPSGEMRARQTNRTNLVHVHLLLWWPIWADPPACFSSFCNLKPPQQAPQLLDRRRAHPLALCIHDGNGSLVALNRPLRLASHQDSLFSSLGVSSFFWSKRGSVGRPQTHATTLSDMLSRSTESILAGWIF